MKKLWLLLLGLLLFAGYMWWVRPGTQESTSTKLETMAKNEVVIQNFAYSPSTITIKVGEAVTWTNKDAAGHSATADDKSFDTGVLAQGESETVTFSKAGTFTYFCTPHPNIKGTIVVE